MNKEKKNGEQYDVLTKRLVLLTAILNLIKAAFDLIGRLLE